MARRTIKPIFEVDGIPGVDPSVSVTGDDSGATPGQPLTSLGGGSGGTFKVDGVAVATADFSSTVPTATELGAIPATLVDAKGDMLVGTADNTVARQAVGATDQVWTVDPTQPGGMAWKTPAAVTAATVYGPTPASQGLKAWLYDSAAGVSTVNGSLTQLWAFRIRAPKSEDWSALPCNVSNTPVLTGAQMAILDATGTLLGATADLAASWNAGSGDKTNTLATPVTVTKDAIYHIVIVQAGTTAAQFRGVTSQVLNTGAASSARRAFSKSSGGASTVSSFDTTTGTSAISTMPWIGVA